MSDQAIDTLTSVLALLVVIEFVLSVVSVIYISRIYVGARRQSRIFRMLVRADGIKVIAGFWIGGLAVYRLLNYPTSLPLWTAPISAIVIMALLFPPIYHAWTFRNLRKTRGDGTPPPWDPED